jgi:PAS domain S-box-containing protein
MARVNAIPALRAKAEQALLGISPYGGQERADQAKLLHELQVHKVELEMQNEALVEALNEADELRTKYHDLYDFAPVAYLTLTSMGAILEANLEATRMLGLTRGKLLNRRLQEFFDPSALSELQQFFSELGDTTQKIKVQSLLLMEKMPIPRYVDGQGHVYVDPASQVRRIRVVLMDVTALRMATDDASNIITNFGELT